MANGKNQYNTRYDLIEQTTHETSATAKHGPPLISDQSSFELHGSGDDAAYSREAESEPRYNDRNDDTIGLRAGTVLQTLVTTSNSHIQLVLILVLLVGTIVFQLIIIFEPIWLSGVDSALTNTQRTLYTLGTTACATLISTLIVGQIRRMWLRLLLCWKATDEKYVRRAQVLLGIAGTKDQFRAYWLVLLVTVCSLLTATITGSMAIAVVGRQYSDRSTAYTMGYPQNTYCYADADSNANMSSTLVWKNSTTNQYIVPQASFDWCPDAVYDRFSKLQSLLGQAYTPDARIFHNVCNHALAGDVLCSALGAPIGLETSCSIFRPFSCIAGTSMSACSPVFYSSPVSCRRSGNVTIDNGTVTAVTGTNCSTTGVFRKYNDHNMIGFCPSSSVVGDMALILGTNDPATNNVLNIMLNDGNHSSTSIECTVSLDTALVFNQVVNTTWLNPENEETYAAINGTGDSCDPGQGSTIAALNSPEVRMAASIFVNLTLDVESLYTLFKQSIITTGDDSQPEITPQTVFASSQNSVEDLLGFYVASAMGYYWGQLDEGMGFDIQYTIAAERIGTGHIAALLYSLPAVCALMVIIWLYVVGRKDTKSHGRQK